MTESVVKETRTEVRVEEVTETRFRCYVCDMVYDEGGVLRIGVDRQASDAKTLFADGAEPRAERTICTHCAEGLFDYDADADGALDEAQTHAGVQPVDVASAVGAVTVLVVLVTAVVAGAFSLVGGQAAFVAVAVGSVLFGLGLGWVL